MTGIYLLSYTCHLPASGIMIYLSYEMPFYTWYIPGIYLSNEIELSRIQVAIEMQQHTGIGLQGCLMFCRGCATGHPSARVRQWPDSGPCGQVAPPSRRRRRWNRRHRRPLQRRRGRAAAAADADVGCGGGVSQPPSTPTTAAA
jgi:hypothetical protein